MTKLAFQFILRRVMEVGGILGSVVGFLLLVWNLIPAPSQQFFMGLVGRQWQEVSLGEIVAYVWPAAIALWGYVWSARSTFKPQIVTDGEQLPLPKDEARRVATKVTTAPRKPSLLQQWFGKKQG